MERLLKRGSLPDNVRREKQEALRQLTEKAALNKRTERERHFSKKYHKVRFFERLKVEKRITLLRKQVAEAPLVTRPTLEEQLRESEYDMLYIKHFPRHKKYLSLFPSAEGNNQYVAKQRAKIRAMLVRRVCNGTLETKERRCASRGNSTDGVDDGDGEVEGGESEDGVEGLDDDEFFARAKEAPVLLAAPAKRIKRGPEAEGAPAWSAGVEPRARKTKKPRALACTRQRESWSAAEIAPSKSKKPKASA